MEDGKQLMDTFIYVIVLEKEHFFLFSKSPLLSRLSSAVKGQVPPTFYCSFYPD